MSFGNTVNKYCKMGHIYTYNALNFVVEPMDYGALSLILRFDCCETRDCVNVTIVNDLVDELEEHFRVTLTRTNGLDSRISLNPVDGQIVILDIGGKYTALINYFD